MQRRTDWKCLWVCLWHTGISSNFRVSRYPCVHSTVISLFSEYHHHPSVRHLSTHQGISLHLVKNLYTCTVQKNVWWSRVFILFWTKRNTKCCFVTIKNDFVFSSIVTTYIQKTLQPTDTGAEHTDIYNQQTLDDSRSYFPLCILPCLSPGGLRVRPGKHQLSMGSALPFFLALPHSLIGHRYKQYNTAVQHWSYQEEADTSFYIHYTVLQNQNYHLFHCSTV